MGKNPLLFLLIFLSMVACKDRPTFPNTPSIHINEIYFKDVNDLSLDSLIIKLQFEDGDGDLGLESFETNPPYHLLDVIVTDGDTLSYGDNDTLPAYNCIDYEILRKETSVDGSLVVTADTIYVVRNPNHFNFYLNFLIEQSDGSFRVYNPALERNCAPPYHGRYFILNTNRDIRPLSGELQYSLLSGFQLLFRDEKIKIQIYILDRSLNHSNIVETDPFYIGDIIRPPG